jgi:hypothetical protein
MSSALLSQAISDKKQVFANYEGYPRQFCPRILGYKNGERLMQELPFDATRWAGVRTSLGRSLAHSA